MTSRIDRVRELPCWRGAVAPRPLAGGLSNHNFTVEDGGAKFVARIGGDMLIHNVMRFNEAACGRAAAAAGIAPRLVHAEADASVIEFIDGATLDAAAVRANLPRILATLKKLHRHGTRALRGPVLAFSVFHVARHYRRLLEENHSRHAPALPRLLDMAARLESAAGGARVALCHNDLLAANFIDDGRAMWLIDWEHAGFNTPLFDLANLASNNAFPEELEREMLARYYGGDGDDGDGGSGGDGGEVDGSDGDGGDDGGDGSRDGDGGDDGGDGNGGGGDGGGGCGDGGDGNASVDAALWRCFKALRAASHLREAMWSMTAEIFSELAQDYPAYTAKNLDDFHQAFTQFTAT
ncbi:MAG: phosphotransferase family protein [Gammaproteobacteria bacterium]|nr:phosphotransferase family protein [Gammaproteobacteria bacterium]